MEQYIKNNCPEEDQKLFLEIYEDLKSLTDFWMRKPWSKTLENLNVLETSFYMIVDNAKNSDKSEKTIIHVHYMQKINELLDSKQSFKLKNDQMSIFNNIKKNFNMLDKMIGINA
jgi:hypothetical protein